VRQGVGKSRLIYEFVRSEPASDWRTFEIGNGIVWDGNQYLPVTEFLRGYFQITAIRRLPGGPGKGDRKLMSLDASLLSHAAALLTLLGPAAGRAVVLEPPRPNAGRALWRP
jgi:hypothetical protein